VIGNTWIGGEISTPVTGAAIDVIGFHVAKLQKKTVIKNAATCGEGRRKHTQEKERNAANWLWLCVRPRGVRIGRRIFESHTFTQVWLCARRVLMSV
jgi:hypothetical protein